MITRMYAREAIGTLPQWHLVTEIRREGKRALGACGHAFEVQDLTARQPDPGEYCLGCEGAEKK